jgi:hypothetical protein
VPATVKILEREALAEEPALAVTLFKPAASNDNDVATGAAVPGSTISVELGAIAKSCAATKVGKPTTTNKMTLSECTALSLTYSKHMNTSPSIPVFILLSSAFTHQSDLTGDRLGHISRSPSNMNWII